MNKSKIIVLAVGLFIARGTHAATITNPVVINSTIFFETLSPNGATIQFDLDAAASVHLEATDQIDTNLTNTQDTFFASSGTVQMFWRAYWLMGDQGGRQNRPYAVTLTPTGGTAVPVGIIRIASVDIHNLTVTTSVDAGGVPSAPYTIAYQLAKAARTRVTVYNSSDTLVRTLVDNVLQVAETVSTNTVVWDGLASDGHPAPLGLYTVYVEATDADPAYFGDTAHVKSRQIAVVSLSNGSSSLQKIFEDNVYVYPNPVRSGQGLFNVLPMRDNARITLKIYTIAGDLVLDRDITGQLPYPWPVVNQSGSKVGRGLYYYVVREEDPQGTLQTTKKMAVLP